jgi:hypothetical protein
VGGGNQGERRGVLNLITTRYARLSLSLSRRVEGRMSNVGVNSMGAGSHSVFRYSVLTVFFFFFFFFHEGNIACDVDGSARRPCCQRADTWRVT